MFGRLNDIIGIVVVFILVRWAAGQSESEGEVKVKEFIGPLRKGAYLDGSLALATQSYARGNEGIAIESRAPSAPCACFEGQCGCCSGMLLEQMGFNVKQRGCMNVTYDPDEFAFDLKMSMNDRVLYANTVSGKNPQPVCIPLPRIRSVKFCVRFSNVYFAGRNVHACINMEGHWQTYTLYDLSFNCVRMGVDGVAVVRPEDGGGLPSVGGGEEEEGEEGEEEEEGDDDEDVDVGESAGDEDYEDILKDLEDVLVEEEDDDDDENEIVVTNNNTVNTAVVPNLTNVVVSSNTSRTNTTVHHKRRKPAPPRLRPTPTKLIALNRQNSSVPIPKIQGLPIV